MRGWLTTVGEIVGIAAIAAGIWLIFPPAAFIFAGLAIGFISFWIGRDA